MPVALVNLPVTSGGNYVRLRSTTEYNIYGQVSKTKTNIFKFGTVSGDVFTVTATDTSQQQITEQFYDAQGRNYKTKLPDGNFVEKVFDTQGRVTAEIDQLNNLKDFTFNSIGQLMKVEYPAVPDPLNSNNPARPTYQYQYNAFGQMSKLTDALGRTTTFGFDSIGRQTERRLPIGYGPDGVQGTGDDGTLPEGQFKETMRYDLRGRVELSVSFEGVHKRTAYADTLAGVGRVTKEQIFANATDYNAYRNGGSFNGNLASNIKWEELTTKYDVYGRVVEVVHKYHSGASAGVATTTSTTDTWTWEFDLLGRLIKETSPTGVIGYEYDSLNRKTKT